MSWFRKYVVSNTSQQPNPCSRANRFLPNLSKYNKTQTSEHPCTARQRPASPAACSSSLRWDTSAEPSECRTSQYRSTVRPEPSHGRRQNQRPDCHHRSRPRAGHPRSQSFVLRREHRCELRVRGRPALPKGIPANLANDLMGGGAPVQNQNAGNPAPQYGNPNANPGNQENDLDDPLGEGGPAMAELQDLIQNPAFEQLRVQARSNPQIIPRIMDHLRDTKPNLHAVRLF